MCRWRHMGSSLLAPIEICIELLVMKVRRAERSAVRHTAKSSCAFICVLARSESIHAELGERISSMLRDCYSAVVLL
jgi:hypothetical protein